MIEFNREGQPLRAALFDQDFKRMNADFVQKQSEKKQEVVAKRVEERLKRAFKGSAQPFNLVRSKTNSQQTALLTQFERMTTTEAIALTLKDISQMGAIEEQVVGRARRLTAE